MKKILMTLAAAFVAVSMSAQNEMYIGGNVNYQSKVNNYDNSFTLAPEFGVKLTDKWGIGATLSLQSFKSLNGNKGTNFTFNPYARYYALNIGKVNVFVDGGMFWTLNETKPKGGDTVTNNKFGLNVTPGISYNISDAFSIVAHANPIFNLTVNSPKEGDTGITANFLQKFSVTTFQFGFYYNF